MRNEIKDLSEMLTDELHDHLMYKMIAGFDIIRRNAPELATYFESMAADEIRHASIIQNLINRLHNHAKPLIYDITIKLDLIDDSKRDFIKMLEDALQDEKDGILAYEHIAEKYPILAPYIEQIIADERRHVDIFTYLLTIVKSEQSFWTPTR